MTKEEFAKEYYRKFSPAGNYPADIKQAFIAGYKKGARGNRERNDGNSFYR